MATARIPQLTFECYPTTKTLTHFDHEHASTDGEVVSLKAQDDSRSQ